MSILFWQSLTNTVWVEPRTSGGIPRSPVSAVAAFPDLKGVRSLRGLRVELLGLEDVEPLRTAWRDLMARALEPNVFMEPAFALTATQHFAQTRRPRFIGVREEGDRGGKLLALWPIESSMSLLAPGVVEGWRHPLTNLGIPIIDRARAGEVTDAVFAFLSECFGSKSALSVPRLLRGGPTFGLLVTRALATGRPWRIVEEHSRAILRRGQESPTFERDILARRRRKELERQARRLGDRGDIAHRSASKPDDVRDAMELFLAMEERGWKGRRRTALLSDSASATFARSMTRLMAREGKCRVDWLEVAGQPVAMGIILTSGDRAYFWKTAYNEDYAQFSPGVQLVRALTRTQLADPNVLSTDSCAITMHPMIDRMWPDRQTVVDLMIALSPERTRAYSRAVRIEQVRRSLRETARSIVHKALARKRS